VLLSTHVLSEASALCSRIVILARGRLVAEDTADGLARRLAGVARLGVRIEGPPEAVASLLASLPGVLRVEPAASDGQAGAAFELLAPDPVPVQRALAASVVHAGWTLLEIRTAVPSLEDLFVQAIAPAGGGAEAPRS
jgi:ABC-2 type transport system ATP-binding protein